MAHREGTFIYHCHVEAVEHVQMGMYGPLVVYQSSQKKAYGKPYEREYIWMFAILVSASEPHVRSSVVAGNSAGRHPAPLGGKAVVGRFAQSRRALPGLRE